MKMVRSEKKKKKMQQNNGNMAGLGIQVKKGPWSPEEDQKLLSYIQQFGHGSWRSLPAKAGLKRCGKSCRMRWTNYLRPDIKRGKFSLEEERTIIQLHALLGNRWSAIASHLPRRTDNDIKNQWNSHIKKRMTKMSIDPMTHKPKSETQLLGSNLNHMVQWESARLEAESRLAKKPPKNNSTQPTYIVSPSHEYHNKTPTNVVPPPYPPCLDVLKVWQGNLWSSYSTNNESLESLISTSNPVPDATTPAMQVLNQVHNQGPTTKHNYEVETHEMAHLEEFKCVNDENFIYDNLLKSTDFWENFAVLDGGWNSLPNNFDMIFSPPLCPGI